MPNIVVLLSCLGVMVKEELAFYVN